MILDPKKANGQRPGFATKADVDEFVDVLEKYERGEIDTAKFKEFRLTRGVYGQRQSEKHMIRVKIPQGILNAAQLRVLGRIARQKSRGFGHVTTRQNIQFHMVELADTEGAMRELLDVGITTREACGNTVRNITACPMAGVCAGEPFDVTAVGEALTRFLLRHPDTQSMPRKFKIAFSGCASDCAFGWIHDIGFLAKLGPEGQPGFRVVAGGGLATHPTQATVVEDFLPAEAVPRSALAIVRVQQKHGERKNRGRARLKYTIQRLGAEEFLRQYRAEWERVTEGEAPPLPRPEIAEAQARTATVTAAGVLGSWARHNVTPQRQEGWAVVKVRLPIGDVTAVQFDALADLSEQASDGTVRVSIDQNVLLRWVRSEDLPRVHAALAMMGLDGTDAGAIDDPTCCPGADTCNLAITHSRRLAPRLAERLASLKTEATRSATVKISGCPNSCGQHHVATIGFHGTTVRAADRVIPAFQLHLGGGVDGDGVTFGRVLDKIPVHRVATAVERLMTAYDRERSAGETPLAYFRKLAKERVTEILGDAVNLTAETIRDEDSEDLDTGVPFRVLKAQGECAS
jgi:sulfite reductase (NADPH) hemoprotein beta-component